MIVPFNKMMPYFLCVDIKNRYPESHKCKEFGSILFENYAKSQLYYNCVSQQFNRDVEDYYKTNRMLREFNTELFDSYYRCVDYYYSDLYYIILYCIKKGFIVDDFTCYSVLNDTIKSNIEKKIFSRDIEIEEREFCLSDIYKDIDNCIGDEPNHDSITYKDIPYAKVLKEVISELKSKFSEMVMSGDLQKKKELSLLVLLYYRYKFCSKRISLEVKE